MKTMKKHVSLWFLLKVACEHKNTGLKLSRNPGEVGNFNGVEKSGIWTRLRKYYADVDIQTILWTSFFEMLSWRNEEKIEETFRSCDYNADIVEYFLRIKQLVPRNEGLNMTESLGQFKTYVIF